MGLIITCVLTEIFKIRRTKRLYITRRIFAHNLRLSRNTLLLSNIIDIYKDCIEEAIDLLSLSSIKSRSTAQPVDEEASTSLPLIEADFKIALRDGLRKATANSLRYRLYIMGCRKGLVECRIHDSSSAYKIALHTSQLTQEDLEFLQIRSTFLY